MSFFDVPAHPGVRLHYETRAGLAPESVFFIHGNLASNRWWLPSEEVWAKEAAGASYTGSLIYAEFPGCGQSSLPSSAADVDMHAFADQFIALIRERGLAPLHLVGHSTGGLIAALMLSKAPELFRRAVLVDPVGANGVKFQPTMIEAFDRMKTDRDFTGLIIGSTITGSAADSSFFRTVIVDDAFSAVKAVGHWVLESLAGLDVRKDVAKIKSPVLVLHGEFDRLLSKDESMALAQAIPMGEFRELAGQGHCPNLENPQKFVQAVRDFLFPRA